MFYPRTAVILLTLAVRVAVINGQVATGCRADICFVMDESGSIGQDNWQTSTKFVADFVDKTAFGDTATKYGVVQFSNTARLTIKLNQYNDKAELTREIRSLSYDSGGTAINIGIQVAREQCFTANNGDRPAEYAPNILILMTDGQSDKTSAVREADLARSEGIIVISIGIGGYDLGTLQEIADSKQGERLFTFENFELLLNDLSLILGESCRTLTDCERGQLIHLTDDYPDIADCPYLSDPYLVDNTLIEFTCNISYNESRVNSDARYKVTFLFDGVSDPAVPVHVLTPPETLVVLKERYLHQRLNKYISCEVESYFASSTEISPGVRSRRYWAGIAPSKKTIDLYEGFDKPVDLYFFSSLPIACDYKTQAVGQCSMTLELSTASDRIAMYQPTTNNYTQIRSCSFRLFYNDWKANESLAYDEQGPLQLLAKRDPQLSLPTTFNLTVKISLAPKHDDMGSFKAAFDDYEPYTTKITVHEQLPAVCRIYHDVWIRTFDRPRAYPAMQQGYFVYVRSSSSRIFEVQGGQFPCYLGGGSSCSVACLVVVREGKYIMALDRCNDNNELLTLALNTESITDVNTVFNYDPSTFGMMITTNPSRTEYMIKTVGGARIVVTFLPRGFNIDITLSARDFQKTKGLCGTFDDDPNNEFIPKGGTVSVGDSNLDQFIESWRLPNKNTLLEGTHSGISETDEQLFCHCADNYNRTNRPIDGASCGFNALEDPLADVDNPREYVRALIPKYIIQAAKRRRKRSTHGAKLRTDDVIDYAPTALPATTDNGPPPAWGSGSHNITEVEARKVCIDAIDGSPAAEACSDVKQTAEYSDMIRTCLQDIQRTGSLEWAAGRRREFNRICVQSIITQDVGDRNSENATALVQSVNAVTSLLCPEDCSGHGTCRSGTCQCTQDYLGADCSVKKTQVPVIKKYLNQGGCDLKENRCRTMRVVAEGVANTPTLTCSITIIKPNGGGTVKKNYPGHLETSNIVRCPLPELKEVTSDILGYSYKVQISNDRINYSPPLQQPVTVVNSKCTQCVNNTCTQKPNTCIINGKCYADGETVNQCLICDSSKSIRAGTPKRGSLPVLRTNRVLYKTEMETLKIQLESDTDDVVYKLVGMTSVGVSITSSGVMTWTLYSQTQNITIRIGLKSCPDTLYQEVKLTLIILSCDDICGQNAICIPKGNTPPGYGNYTCTCKEDKKAFCQPDTCPDKVPCVNLTCSYRCDYPMETWSEWSQYGSCSKPCDYGLKKRTRKCLGPPCFDKSVEMLVCNKWNCPEIKAEEEQSITLEFQQTSIERIVPKRDLILAFIASALNEYCVVQPDRCCRAVGMRAKFHPEGADQMFHDYNIREAAGYPKDVDDNVKWRLYSQLYTATVDNICTFPSTKRRKRESPEYRTVSPALLTAVVSAKLPELSEIVQTNVTMIEPGDTVSDSVIIAVACLGAILGVAIFAVVVAVMVKSYQRKTKKRRASDPQTSVPVFRRAPANYKPTRFTDNYDRYRSPNLGGAYSSPGYTGLYASSMYPGTYPYSMPALMPRDGTYATLQSLYNSPQIDRRSYIGYPEMAANYRI